MSLATLPHAPKTAALVAYAAGRLSPAARARLEHHLGRCATCRQQLAGIRAYDHLAREVRSTPYPEPDWGKMRDALERDAEVWRARRNRWWIASGVAVVLLFLGGLLVHRGLRPADEAAIRKELERASAALHACVDEARAVQADLPGDVRLHLTVAGDGSVESGRVVAADGASTPPGLSRCLLEVVSTRTFVASGERASFEIPLSFPALRR